MRTKVLSGIALVCYALIIALTVYSVLTFFFSPADGFMQVSGFNCFRYFTVDSNIFCAFGSLLALPACVAGLRGKPFALSRRVLLLRFSGTAAVTVTLLTVLLFLGPTMGYAGMFAGPSLWMHGVTPVLAILVFILIEDQGRITFSDIWCGVLPVAAYACVYIPLVVFTRIWPDFYGFNVGGYWYVSAPIMLAASALISLGLAALQRKGRTK